MHKAIQEATNDVDKFKTINDMATKNLAIAKRGGGSVKLEPEENTSNCSNTGGGGRGGGVRGGGSRGGGRGGGGRGGGRRGRYFADKFMKQFINYITS